MHMSDLIKLTPIFHEKIWGGRQLETVFGYDIPEGPIGECWAISAHPNGDCQIAEGPYAGHTLSWLWAEHRELFGNCEGKEFPLLIKILDAKDDLSIQIHPNDEYAAEHENGSLGKTECWYVLDCEPGATIIVGQRAHDRAEAAQMIEEGRWDEMLNVLPIHKGDFFQIDSGTVHAIKTGTLILETQQSSDVTYRLYDYDRPGTDGKLRPLHIEQSLDCINFDAQAPTDGTVTAPEVDGVTGHAELRPHSAELEPELTLLPGELPWLRLRISADGGRQYVVKSIPDLLRAVEKHGFISYGKALEFQHSWEAFAPEAQQLLRLLRRQLSAKEGAEAALRSYGNAPRSGPAGGIPLNGEIFDGLVALYAPTGNLGGYTLKTGIPALTMRVEKRRGGVEVSVTPALGWKTGLDNDYLYSEDTIWQLDRAESARMRPALEALCGKSLFFTTGDATAFCSYVLPELGSRVTIEDPERLLLNQIPLEPVVQFYLDAPTRETVRAHLEFLYGEDRVTPEALPVCCGMPAPNSGPGGCWGGTWSRGQTPWATALPPTTMPMRRMKSTASSMRASRPCWLRARST